MPFGSPISLRGPQGEQGIAGLGVIFVQGPPSASLQGAADQLAIDTSALDAYRYDGSQWAFAANLRGPMGLSGVDGSFFAGSAAPNASTYAGEGQAIYLQATGELWLYQSKEEGWKDSGQSLLGPKGETGAVGARGSQRFIGSGPPPSDTSTLANGNVSDGAKVGDEYVDNSDVNNPVLYLFT